MRHRLVWRSASESVYLIPRLYARTVMLIRLNMFIVFLYYNVNYISEKTRVCVIYICCLVRTTIQYVFYLFCFFGFVSITNVSSIFIYLFVSYLFILYFCCYFWLLHIFIHYYYFIVGRELLTSETWLLKLYNFELQYFS